jgi:hypothetical protein
MKNIYLFLLTFLVPVSIVFSQLRVYPPELNAPENGATGQMPNVQLNWNAVTGGGVEIYYEVQLSENDQFSNPVEFPLTMLTAVSASELNFGDTYYWRVRAHDGDDVSGWSEAWSFEVVNSVNVTSPSDGAEVNPQVDLVWDEVVGANMYQILVDTLYYWQKESVPFDNSIRAITIINSSSFGGVGDDGLIFYYENNQWNISESGTTKDLYSVEFLNENEGWVVGKGGIVLHYDGNSWTTVDIGTSLDLYDITFADANNGWISAKNGKIFYYDGTGWVEQNSGTSKYLYSIWALSADDVWAVGKGGVFTHYDGTSWTASTEGTKDYLSLWFNSSTDGWAVAKSGRYAHWDGNNWTEENIGVSKNLYSIAFVNENIGFAVGQSGSLFRYYNGTWTKITSGTSNDLYSIFFNNGVGLYGGKNGDLFKYTGSAFDSPYATIYNIDGNETSFYLSDLYFGKTYYYKMRAAHSNDTSDWSAARSFKVQTAPVLSSPANGEEDLPLQVIIDWKDFAGIVKYNISIADNPQFNNAFNFFSDSSSFLITGLGFGTEYYWRVNAQNSFSTSPWSDVWKFKTVNTIELTSPENGAVNVDPCPLIKWEEVIGASSYEVWLDTTSNFLNPMKRIENTDHAQCQMPLIKGQEYFWKVRGIYSLDTSAWSPVWSFTVEGPQGVEEDYLNNSISIYPNPSNSGRFNVVFNSIIQEQLTFSVVDILGKEIYNTEYRALPGKNSLLLNIGNINSGIYYLIIRGEKLLITRKIKID